MSYEFESRPGEASVGQVTTTSDLVRRFGHWQQRAARGPVYILRRGRPRYVLTTVQVMDALCAQYVSTDDSVDVAALLDGVEDIVLAARKGIIVAASRAARAFLGDSADLDASIADIAIPPLRPQFGEMLERIRATGRRDSIDLATARPDGRPLAFVIEPRGDQLILFGRDRAIEAAALAARAEHDAAIESLGVIADILQVRLDLRERLDPPWGMIATLTGLTPDTVATLSFSNLFDKPSRGIVAAAIAAVIADGAPRRVDADLATGDGIRRVTIGFAAQCAAMSIQRVVATLLLGTRASG